MIEVKRETGLNGLVRLDGDILEIFGFKREYSLRIHVNQISCVSLGKVRRSGSGEMELNLEIRYDTYIGQAFFEAGKIKPLEELVDLLSKKIISH
ncbi:MAG TPA: hypothetical protein VN426_01170 [Syntrophomonadaceae bacterium]|nr:hypothetical protein [Syntrophomonadaceae bacterium]